MEAQEEKVRAYCVAKDWDLIRVVRDEGYSAKDLNRPGIQEIICRCARREFDVLVILKLDRLTRSVRDLGYLIEDVLTKNNIAFSSLQDNFDTSTANGKMTMHLLATLAQWERDMVSERTRDAMQFMKQGLTLVGAVPFGFELVDGQLHPHPQEIATIQTIVSLRKQGYSYRSIASYLTTHTIPSKRGRRWHPKTILGVVRYMRSLPGDHWVITTYFPEGVEVPTRFTRICPRCGGQFTTKGSPQIYCSKVCQRRTWVDNHKEQLNTMMRHRRFKQVMTSA